MEKDVNLLTSNGVNVNKSLELFGDMDTYNESIGDFLTGTEERIEKIKKFKESADMANYAIEVHALKSDARYFGFDQLGELAFQHEKESKAKNIYYIYENYDHLMNETMKAMNLVKQYLGQEITQKVEQPKPKVLRSKTILVVDDSMVIRNFVQQMFSDQYNVYVAEDGLEALNMIANDTENKIIAMLLDLNMPNVDGFAVLEYFKDRNLFFRTPISLITGEGNQEIISKAMEYPIVAVLRKPFNERDIKKVVEETIRTRMENN